MPQRIGTPRPGWSLPALDDSPGPGPVLRRVWSLAKRRTTLNVVRRLLPPVGKRFKDADGIVRVRPAPPPKSAEEGRRSWGSPWEVEYECVPQDGEIVVAAIVIGLREGADLPAGGLSARQLRQLRPGSDIQQLRGVLEADFSEEVEHLGYRIRKSKPDATGSLPPRHYAEIAAAYVAARRKSKTPIKTLAAAWGLSDTQARDRVEGARRKGMLTRPTQGRVGGGLTDEARKVLREQGRRKR